MEKVMSAIRDGSSTDEIHLQHIHLDVYLSITVMVVRGNLSIDIRDRISGTYIYTLETGRYIVDHTQQ